MWHGRVGTRIAHRRMFQSGSRCLIGPPAELQLFFCSFNQSLLMLARGVVGDALASSKRSGKSTGLLAAFTSLYRIRFRRPVQEDVLVGSACGFAA